MKIEIRRSVSDSQRYYARIVAGNNRVLFTSETYVNKSDAIRAAALVKLGAASATIVDETAARIGRP